MRFEVGHLEIQYILSLSVAGYQRAHIDIWCLAQRIAALRYHADYDRIAYLSVCNTAIYSTGVSTHESNVRKSQEIQAQQQGHVVSDREAKGGKGSSAKLGSEQS
jgi:hypothetical protein